MVVLARGECRSESAWRYLGASCARKRAGKPWPAISQQIPPTAPSGKSRLHATAAASGPVPPNAGQAMGLQATLVRGQRSVSVLCPDRVGGLHRRHLRKRRRPQPQHCRHWIRRRQSLPRAASQSQLKRQPLQLPNLWSRPLRPEPLPRMLNRLPQRNPTATRPPPIPSQDCRPSP